ncbi:MAG: carbohydrate ABC transporter permease [Ruminococcaceae bacterium]|nr:carbohydrate ABC transporter permease [Oscillospiraceae bacterium]
MSEKDLESMNDVSFDDLLVNDAASAPADEASAEAVGEAIAQINEEVTETAEETAETAKSITTVSADELQSGVTPIERKMTRKEKKLEKKQAKEAKNIYHVSNWQIIKNYRTYNKQERAHYRYIFGRRIAEKVWPVFRFLILFGLGFVILYPLLYMLSTSIRPQIEMTDPSVMWIPKNVIFSNFVEVWQAINFPEVLLRTILINVVCSVLQVITCGITGYGFARFKFKGKGLMFGIVIFQIIVPVQVVLIPLYMQFRFFDVFGIIKLITGTPLNLVSTPAALYLQALFCNGIRAGVFILLFRQFFRGLPKELEDAAYLDGCGPVKTFVKVMIPNAKTSFLTVFIFSIVWYWNDSYVTGMFFTEPYTIAMEINNIATKMMIFFTGETNGMASDYLVWIEAGCLLSLLPILIMYIFLQKQFVEGVERSGLVG